MSLKFPLKSGWWIIPFAGLGTVVWCLILGVV